MEKNLIDKMVDRFLCWKLPEDFAPDCGISFSPTHGFGTPHWPIGTNLLTAEQAKQMFEHCLGLEEECTHEWISNSGRGGDPDFRLNRQMSPEPLMHVMCAKCGTRTWMTRQQWELRIGDHDLLDAMDAVAQVIGP